MSEQSVIEQTTQLHTIQSLSQELKQLGIRAGMNLTVHSSLSSIGYVSGGAVAVVQALMDVVTPMGTIIMPTHTSDNSDPAGWGNPPVPAEWWTIMRETMPAFHPDYTPTRGVGKIVEVFRTFPQVARSSHPLYSFAAWGKYAAYITEDQSLNYPMGEGSPLAKLYDLSGNILLIGVGHDSNTSLHLAEYRQAKQTDVKESAAMTRDGKREWVTFSNVEYQTELFPQLGVEYEMNHSFVAGKLGNAKVGLFSQVDIVDFAVKWLNER